MFHSRKSPLKVSWQNKADQEYPLPSRSNPFDSDDESDIKQTHKPSTKTLSHSNQNSHLSSTSPFDDDEEKVLPSSSSNSLTYATRNKYKNDFCDSGGLESQSVQELENYAVYKTEETTKAVNECLKIAEGIREDATKTLITLHQQGEQITKTHNVTVDMDHDLSWGENLLGSLGGMFSKPWKPKKSRPVMGPVITRDDSPKRRGNHLVQREKLRSNSAPKARTSTRTPPPEPTNAFHKVEMEKAKQDDTLSDLSNLLGELEVMALDMGSEIDRENKAIDNLQDDVDVLNDHVRGANYRGRRLLGK